MSPSELPLAGPASGGPPPTARVVQTDRPCRECGYNLRGLPEPGRCPECGARWERPEGRALLESAPAGYVRRLHLGSVLVLSGLSAAFALMFVGMGIAVLRAGGVLAVGAGLETLAEWGTFGASAVAVLGWWWLSSPQPGTPLQAGGSRSLLRVCLVIWLSCALVGLVVEVALPAGGFVLEAVGGTIALAAAAAWIVQYFASLAFMRTLARRIPSAALEAGAKRAMWLGPALMAGGAAVVLGAWTVGALAVGAAFSGDDSGWFAAMVVVVVGTIGGAGALVAAVVVYLRVIDRYRLALRGVRMGGAG